MIGAIVGDIVGSRFEFNNHRSKDFELFGEDNNAPAGVCKSGANFNDLSGAFYQ